MGTPGTVSNHVTAKETIEERVKRIIIETTTPIVSTENSNLSAIAYLVRDREYAEAERLAVSTFGKTNVLSVEVRTLGETQRELIDPIRDRTSPYLDDLSQWKSWRKTGFRGIMAAVAFAPVGIVGLLTNDMAMQIAGLVGTEVGLLAFGSGRLFSKIIHNDSITLPKAAPSADAQRIQKNLNMEAAKICQELSKDLS